MGNNSLRDNDSAVKNNGDATSIAGTQAQNASDLLRSEHDSLVCSGPKTVERVNENNFSKLALNAFDKIDINKDGVLDKLELKHSITSNSSLPCASMDAAQVMLKNFDVVRSFEGLDEPEARQGDNGFTHPGISRADLLKFDKIRAGDGLYAGYAKQSVAISGIVTALYAGLPTSIITGGAGVFGEGMIAVGATLATGLTAGAAIGGGIAAGVNYYSYRHNHVPKVRTFFDDINAGAELRSRV